MGCNFVRTSDRSRESFKHGGRAALFTSLQQRVLPRVSVELGRLAETKPVVHEHDWVRMTLSGAAEQASGGTLYSTTGEPDADAHLIFFLFPVNRLSLRNPHNDPYRSVIVEIMKKDDTLNRLDDPTLSQLAQIEGP
jgi:hypothetical protein